VNAPAILPSIPTREQIDRLEGELLAAERAGAGVAIPTWHHFADGLVARTIFIEAGTALTGAPHKAEHMNVCYGDIEVWTEQGMKRLTGYHVIPSLPGTKRVGLTFADTWWTTVHLNPSNERDIAKLEDALVEAPESLQRRRLHLVGADHKELLS
jgi:hypothetical protein